MDSPSLDFAIERILPEISFSSERDLPVSSCTVHASRFSLFFLFVSNFYISCGGLIARFSLNEPL